MLKSVALIALLLAAIFLTPWAWIGVVLISLWKWRIWYRYNGRPWRKVHFNAMIFASAAVAREKARSTSCGEPFNQQKMYEEILISLGTIGFVTPQEHKYLIDTCLLGIEQKDDESSAMSYMVDIKKMSFSDALENTLNLKKAIELSPQGENYLKLRALIASVIEDQYSLKDKNEYWFEVFSNRAP